MKVEISSLFHLGSHYANPVRRYHIGSGVHIEELNESWLQEAKAQCPKIGAREQLEYVPSYTHRFSYEVGLEPDDLDSSTEVTGEEKQPILKAIALSRVVKPTSIGYDNLWVKSFYQDSKDARHSSNPIVNAHSVAYVSEEDGRNTITEDDARSMAELWDSLQYFFDGSIEPKYRRIVRAFKYHEIAYPIHFAEARHIMFHAALESMICAGYHQNKAQVTQRLPKLVPFIKTEDAKDIYELCGNVKHEAQAMLQQKPTSSGELSPSDLRRINAVVLLQKAVRYLLVESLRNITFANVLADENALKLKYPVFNKQGKLV